MSSGFGFEISPNIFPGMHTEICTFASLKTSVGMLSGNRQENVKMIFLRAPPGGQDFFICVRFLRTFL